VQRIADDDVGAVVAAEQAAEGLDIGTAVAGAVEGEERLSSSVMATPMRRSPTSRAAIRFFAGSGNNSGAASTLRVYCGHTIFAERGRTCGF